MDPQAKAFFEEALKTPSPSGFETKIQDLVRGHMESVADEIRTDVHGNVMAIRNPDAPIRLMFAGHCDQIGLIVHYIDADGFLYVLSLGGWDPQNLLGQRLHIWTKKGPISGIIARKPIHLLTDEERKKVPKIQDLWIDIGASSKEEAEELVTIGDPVTVELEPRELLNGRIASPATDDKSGMWVVMEALRRIDASKLNCAVYAVSTVQEESGLRGARTSAFNIDPHAGIAVDVTFATDCPTIEKKQLSEVKVGSGPVVYRGPNMNTKLVDQVVSLSEKNEIPIQLAADGRPTGTDANVMQITRAGVATGLVSVPNRYMHSPVEIVSLDDMDHAADLLARFAESVDESSDFIPS
jgi:endoglucanase